MTDRVLIANRGEIAIRIAHAASALHIESVAVCTSADERSLHTRVATQVRQLPGEAVAGYLDGDALLRVARETSCTLVHPGYGFLSEQVHFARACADAGVVFVGPDADALHLFGDKVAARAFVRALGVPVVDGSDTAVMSADEAAEVAARIGYPVMVKAAAGGGGRGMRSVERPEALADAFAACTREAAAAFGNGHLFIERLIEHPRHVEVQIAGDRHGTVVHLHDRDCSVQLRNQKVIEIAPAPNLDGAVRERVLTDAVRIAKAIGYAGVGTMEFLVSPESGQHCFIECNPRLQVEHTVTEEVTGVDIVELQFALARGASLASLGLGDQERIGQPRGFAVQARVVATGGGVLRAYKEPTGARVRVDACGYVGYTPPPQFDPLVAKVIGRSGSDASLASALDRTAQALTEFHIDGLPTNVGQLLALLHDPSVRAGDARTSLASRFAIAAQPAASGLVALLDAGAAPRASGAGVSDGGGQTLSIEPGQHGVSVPVTSVVTEIRVTSGDRVRRGQVLLVVSAMKMETAIESPCDGVVAAMLDVAPGASVSAGDIVALVSPQDHRGGPDVVTSGASWTPVLAQAQTLRDLADARLAPGSDDPGVVRQRSRGKLTCRERIALLLDGGSFREVGSAAGFASYGTYGAIEAFTPANHVGGSGRIDGRDAIVCADDFTSRGGHADGAIATKSSLLDRLSIERRIPSVRLLDGSSGGGSVAAMVPEQRSDGESTALESRGAITAGQPRVAGGGGSFLPGHLGSTMYAEQLATVPVVNVLLGSVVGLGAAKAVLGHFSVMVRDVAQLFVAGPPVVRHAMGVDVSKEELGGWHIHCRNGSVDNLAETEAHAIAMTKRFLSYLPPSVHEAPPVTSPGPDDAADRRDDELLDLIPRRRTTTFDIRHAIEVMADRDSFFEIGALWGTDQVVGFVRMDGHPMGVVASDSRHVNGGALTADGCDKVRRHLEVCDLFHLPVLNLIDNPGFAVGVEHEIAGTIRKGGEWMIAFAQIRVPLFTVIMRRSFGVAGNNWATPQAQPSVRVIWPSADMGGIPPEGGIEAAYKRQLAEAADPVALRAEIESRIESARGPLGPLSKFQVEEMIDPRDTRALVCEWVRSAYRLVSHADRLGPRAIGFRP